MAKKLDKSRSYGVIFGQCDVPGLEDARYYQDGKYFTGAGKLIVNSGKISRKQNKKEQEIEDAIEETAENLPPLENSAEENREFLEVPEGMPPELAGDPPVILSGTASMRRVVTAAIAARESDETATMDG